jgi:hypothetical protein
MSLWNFTIQDNSPFITYCKCRCLRDVSICLTNRRQHRSVRHKWKAGSRLTKRDSFLVADGSLAHGWQPWYSQSGFLKTPGEGGEGDSFHSTALPGATLNLEFHGAPSLLIWREILIAEKAVLTGTGVNLYGETNSSYAVTIDNVAQNVTAATGDTLFVATGLKNGAHNCESRR